MPSQRSLILAGGGMKVAFQAGALQVWLDDAGIEFDHADGASGGCLNLVLWVQGMSGTEIAERWRRLDPKALIDFNWLQYLRLFHAESLFTLDHWREDVFPAWGLDWNAIHSSPRAASFNIYNFTRHELVAVEPAHMSEAHLIASISLPMWFPPVVIDGETWTDAVFVTDANLMEAIRRGADELWIIWTVSEAGTWHDGFLAQYFQIIEQTAVGRFKQDLARIEASNRAIKAGRTGEFDRVIEIKLLKAEVPLHYLINLSQDRVAESVNRGVEAARAWCSENAIPMRQAKKPYPTAVHEAHTTVRFREVMRGHVSLGESDPESGERLGRTANSSLECRLEIFVDGVNRFVTLSDHVAEASGTVICAAFGGERPIDRGTFNLFIDKGNPRRKEMRYRLEFTDNAGEALTLLGRKHVYDDPSRDIWSDTTTLFVRVFRGRIETGAEDGAKVMAAGIIHVHLLDFLKQLTTFTATGPSASDRTAALTRFGRFFMGSLWDVYASHILTWSPA